MRFVRNKAAMASLFILAMIVLFTIIGPYFAVWSNEEIDWNVMGDVRGMGMPSVETGHFFGVDDLGRDLYSRTIQATRTSLLVGLIGAGMALVVGTFYGIIAGYFGGRLDGLMMRFVDILLAIPTTLVIILILVVAGKSFTTLFLALGAVSWLTMSRIVRGQTLALKSREFIEAARSEPAGRALPMLLLTTETAEELKARARQAKATGWLTKPFDPDVILGLVKQLA